MDALIGIFAAICLTVVALTVFLVRHARNPSPWGIPPGPPGAERPAIGPRDVHQHWHLHVGAGADPAAVAEILRRHQAE
jgi:hypothetical protein